MALTLRRQDRPSKFEQAADGSMTLIEHIRELRNRLFWASIGIVAGLIVGFIISRWTFDMLSQPYCSLDTSWSINAVTGVRECRFITLVVGDQLILRLKIALWVG